MLPHMGSPPGAALRGCPMRHPQGRGTSPPRMPPASPQRSEEVEGLSGEGTQQRRHVALAQAVILVHLRYMRDTRRSAQAGSAALAEPVLGPRASKHCTWPTNGPKECSTAVAVPQQQQQQQSAC